MCLKKYYYNKGIECCYTCRFIDEYAFNVRNDGEVPHGWDGTALCCAFNKEQPEGENNRLCVSPLWKACKKYVKCTERQAEYLDIYDYKLNTIIKNPNDISKIKESD